MTRKYVYKIGLSWRNGYAPDQVSRITWGELKAMMDDAGVDDDDELVVDLGQRYGANYYGINTVESCEMDDADEKCKSSLQKKKESLHRKKSEAAKDKITMGIDYTMFMRMCASAAYLEENEDYWDALWNAYLEFGGDIEDALEFFDNLFQYTRWVTPGELMDELISYDPQNEILKGDPDEYTDEELCDKWLEENDYVLNGENVYKGNYGYLIIH